MFQSADFDGHEKVLFVSDSATGLRAIIALHSTALGPAAGGCRLWSYANEDAALGDSLRLSKGMSYKNAMANLPFGGGKAVVLGPLSKDERAACFRALGDAINMLGGAYITAEDVGVHVSDMLAVAERTRFVSGIKTDAKSAGGDPSPFTARGVARGIEAIAARHLGRGDLGGMRIAVQGVGNVGENLCRELSARGAKLVVADIDAKRVERVCDQFAATPVAVDDILLADVDIVAPCALGGTITADIAKSLRARAVAGGANNQLANAEAGKILFERGIGYAPDYVINAGGIIAVAGEYLGDNDEGKVLTAIDAIGPRVDEILARAEHEKRPSFEIADALAQAIIARAT